jgi:bifunctional DNA-binding transcriptional regulator/antitoxin component of YhaV-PrlF toxin-antitoxin module
MTTKEKQLKEAYREMYKNVRTIRSDGSIIIPQDILKKAFLEKGNQVTISIDGDTIKIHGVSDLN